MKHTLKMLIAKLNGGNMCKSVNVTMVSSETTNEVVLFDEQGVQIPNTEAFFKECLDNEIRVNVVCVKESELKDFQYHHSQPRVTKTVVLGAGPSLQTIQHMGRQTYRDFQERAKLMEINIPASQSLQSYAPGKRKHFDQHTGQLHPTRFKVGNNKTKRW